MALLQDLIQQIDDPALRDRILKETNKLAKNKKFGLVFEDHLPECTPLYDVPIRVGSKVALKNGKVNDFYVVQKIQGEVVYCNHRETHEIETFNINELVVIAEFGEPIYPTLKPIDYVENAPDSDLWHTLIEADNYHALQLLEYLYAEKVDCIYIDPPYNTGAKDWKYNNDYVDGNDAYRHSKWLSMMEKRLKLAKKLLNPTDSVLIVTIDEKEYLHLGCLLEELFQGANIQMISSVINPSGSSRKNYFSRAEEYIYYVFIGEASVSASDTDMIHPPQENLQVRWASLLRSGSNSSRSSRPRLFYPIFFSNTDGSFKGTGDSLTIDENRDLVQAPNNCFAVWPIKANQEEARWTLSQDTLKDKISKGYVKFGPWKNGELNRTISYLSEGMEKAIVNGELEILGRDENGTLITGRSFKPIIPLTIWNKPSHSAGDFGSSLLLNIFITKRFTFPKSLYAVHDTIRFFVAKKPNALIVDFFAGSGTTLHAVNLLNSEDCGKRRCIMVTNNEVSEAESKSLYESGYRVGDPEWDKFGIARYVTWPRTVCSIEGHDVNGEPLKGKYIGSELEMSEGFKANAKFFKLGFLDKTSVALGRQFKELLPVLWMKGGAVGKCPELTEDDIPPMLILEDNKMAILTDEIYYSEFDAKLKAYPTIQTIFIITDSENAYREMVRSYNDKECYQLYRDYLDNFRINTRR